MMIYKSPLRTIIFDLLKKFIWFLKIDELIKIIVFIDVKFLTKIEKPMYE